MVTAGTILGTVALNKDGITGFTEVSLKKVVGNQTTFYCPLDFLDPQIKTSFLGRVTQLMNEWEEYVGDTNIYNQADQPTPGCVVKSYSE